MSLVEMINSLIDDLGRGLNDSTIRSRLLSLREQAEAIDLDLQRARADLKRLKKDAKAQEIVSEQDSVEEFEDGAKKLLQFLFNSGDSAFIEEMANTLGFAKSMAGYDVETLKRTGMIEVVAFTPGGPRYALTAKGRVHVVRNKLAE